jgi:hypothetical protein
MQKDKHENFDYVVDKRKEKLTPIGSEEDQFKIQNSLVLSVKI